MEWALHGVLLRNRGVVLQAFQVRPIVVPFAGNLVLDPGTPSMYGGGRTEPSMGSSVPLL